MRSELHKAAIRVGLFLAVIGSSGVYADTAAKKAETDVQSHVDDVILGKNMISVTFTEGSSELSDHSLTSLADFVKATNDKAKIDRYLVAAWGDKAYPAKGELSSGQRKLAKDRADKIKKALEAGGVAKVDTFEMTKQPNWIQRVFSTETAEIKGKGLSATEHQRLIKQIGERIDEKGGPRMAVVVAKFKNEAAAH